jgi:HK97 family phage portal protein
LVRNYRRPSRLRQFFRPIYSTIPGVIRSTFRLWGGGAESVGPVNSSVSYSGTTITPDLALTLSAVWGCVFRVSGTVASLPLFLMRTGPGNSAKPAYDHPLYGVLHDQPNQQMSASAFWMVMVTSMMLWGTGYARKLRSGSRIVGLRPWRPEFVTIYRLENGEIRYRYAPNSQEVEDLPAEEVFAVFDRSLDGLVGLSRIDFARNSFGLALGADQASGVSYRNGLRASGLLTIANWLKPEQREQYRTRLQEFMGTGTGTSADRQGGVMIVENATKFEALSMKPADVELLASRRFSVEDVCRWFDVPPILVGHSAEGQTMWGTGVEQVFLGWFKLGLAPTIRRIEQEIYRQLLTPVERLTLFAEYNLDALLRGDSVGRSTVYSVLSQNGLRTRNELRALDNQPPLPGGDVLTVQSNLVPLDQLGKAAGATVQVRSALRDFLGIDEPAEVDRET